MAETITLILFPGAVACELVMTAELLSPKLTVQVATPDGADHADASGLTYRASCAFADVDLEDCAAIVVAGGDLLGIWDNRDLSSLLVRADQRKILLGAICAGPLALAQAGVLAGHRYTQGGYYPPSAVPLWDGAELVRETLVVSDHVITAMPEAHVAFAVEIGVRLGAFDRTAGRRKLGFYTNNYERDWSQVGVVEEEG